jgi:hypothetical protein
VFFFSFVYAVLAIQNFAALAGLKLLLVAAPNIAITYLVLALKYWFRIPAIGSALGAICFVAGFFLTR